MRIAFRGAPGTGAAQTAVGTWLTRKTVTRLLVRQAARINSAKSEVAGISDLT